MTDEVKDMLIANLMNRLENIQPGSGKQLLDEVKFNNFVSEIEYNNLVSQFKNHDNTKGPKISIDALRSVLEKTSGVWIKLEPYYNEWALFLVINYIMSMSSKLVYEISTKTGISSILICYDLACGMLKDKNKPKWLRKHFDLA